MAETLRQRMARGYAFQIYVDGTKRFSDVNATYHEEIKQYAADNFTIEPYAPPENRTIQLDKAWANSWTNQLEYDQTVAKIGPYPTT